MQVEKNGKDIGCTGSWLILIVIGVICSIISSTTDYISESWDSFLIYEQKENGAVGGTLIVAFTPIIIIIMFVLLYSKINNK